MKNSPLARNPRYQDVDIVLLYRSTIFGGSPENSFIKNDFKTYTCNITNEKTNEIWQSNVKVLLTADETLSKYAHSCIYHGADVRYGQRIVTKKKEGEPILIYHTMESPALTSVSLADESTAKQFHLLMSYHFDSDIFLPYIGRGTLRLLMDKLILVPFQQKNAQYPLAWIGSNCDAQNGRQDYLRSLFQHIPTHSYGRCLNTNNLSVCNIL
ncbi:hypothetical protein RFI_17059 [Reticulomyxa filosa]|uniref:Fucosyltransferase n=1 Tax=Reticulomyxa filosa TaxID=46433 RepID=X6N2N0_RETFI|nr:hypothetical protein RFI_17059 [Reticulomyxa filosa]|eukprot:ETO20158.1 hypothetical protein RFI_17059 [Reticulomyxa filosa]